MIDPRPVRGMIFVGAGTYVGDKDDLWIHKNAYDAITARVAELEAEIRQLGEIGDVCTYSTLQTVCTGCRCKRRPPADNSKHSNSTKETT